jgi:hypothetical protein
MPDRIENSASPKINLRRLDEGTSDEEFAQT